LDSRSGQGLLSQRGVVLRRKDSPDGNRSVYVLLENEGPVWLLAPGAARGKVRFGGATDPLVWGTFHVYRGTSRSYLRDVDVRKDFWSLRRSPQRIRQAVDWSVSISRFALPGHPCNDLMPVFFWSLCLLEDPNSREDLVDWRFYWRWLRSWGLATELDRCHTCGNPPAGAIFSGETLLCEKCTGGHPGEGVRLKSGELRELGEAASVRQGDFPGRSAEMLIRPETVRGCTKILEDTLVKRA